LMPNTSAGEERVECHATIDNLTFGVHARVFSSGRATLRVPLSLTLSPDPYGLAVTPT
jgi:hypothetical protein